MNTQSIAPSIAATAVVRRDIGAAQRSLMYVRTHLEALEFDIGNIINSAGVWGPELLTTDDTRQAAGQLQDNLDSIAGRIQLIKSKLYEATNDG